MLKHTQKIFLALGLWMMIGNVWAIEDCSDRPLQMEDLLAYFSPGAMKSKVFMHFETTKAVRQCNSLTGCGPWSEVKANLKIREILNSDTLEEVEHFLPRKADAFFEITKKGEILLRFFFKDIDVYARPTFSLGSTAIELNANDFFRAAPGHSPPVLGVSYFQDQDHIPFVMKGQITQDCMELHSTFKVKREGITYDEFDVSFFGVGQ